MNKIVVILGPTASGKTDLSIRLAKKYNGEIISADSRQVYKGLDIGSGKITKKEMKGVPHYLLDVADPKRKFTVARYKKLAEKVIKRIQKDGKLPIIVGGTGFYIQSIVDGTIIPEIKPNWELRKKIEKMGCKEMFIKLKNLDPVRAKNIDKNNPRRLVRALEIILTTKKPVPEIATKKITYQVLKIGIKKSSEELKNLIHKRLTKRLKKNLMIKEIKNLHKAGVSWKRLEEFGLEYRIVAQYLQNKVSFEEMKSKIQIDSEHYAKRQMTWFKRDKKIIWVDNLKHSKKVLDSFLETL